jgi:hypothetical protein
MLSTATKPKTLQTEEASITGSNHNVTANTSQDCEFIPFENEQIVVVICMLKYHSFATALHFLL